MPRIQKPADLGPVSSRNFDKLPAELLEFLGHAVYDAVRNAADKADLYANPDNYFRTRAAGLGVSVVVNDILDNVRIVVHEDRDVTDPKTDRTLRILNLVLPAEVADKPDGTSLGDTAAAAAPNAASYLLTLGHVVIMGCK